MRFARLLAVFLLCFPACKSSKNSQQSSPSESSAAQQTAPASPFFAGPPAQGFEQAKHLQKPIFLYWGAAWCPPCNELKARIFSTPRFAEWMKSFVPISLDGDSEEAQQWAEKLKISAYPTLLILSPEGREQVRLSTSLSTQEFESALTLYWSKNTAFESAFQSLAQGSETSPEELRLLASVDFSVLPADAFPHARLLNSLQIAWERASKPGLERERAIFASALLQGAIEEQDSGLKSKAQMYFDSILLNSETAFAARVFVCTWLKPSLQWLFESARGEAFLALKKQWLKAADSIRAHKEATAEIKLLALGPALEFAEQESGPAALPDAIRKNMLELVRQSLREAPAPHERHALLGHAAFFLKRLGEIQEAKALLLEDANTSKTPWYCYSSLASLEEQAGNLDQALIWSEKARRTAQGRASRLQWMANDFVLHAKVNPSENSAYLIALLEEYYSLAFSLGDGFMGRNQTRAEQIKTALAALSGPKDLLQLRRRFREQCHNLKGENQNNCQSHFQGAAD